MFLSNTAVPKYYGEFREKVIRGEIPINREIEMEMNRIDDLIRNPGVYYCESKVEGFIRFCEDELTLTDGQPVKMLFMFKVWGEQVFGWYYYIERTEYELYETKPGGHYVRKRILKRLIEKMYLIVGRGAAKTLFASFILQYFLVTDSETIHELATSPTMRQSEEITGPIRTAIARSRGPVYQFLTAGSIRNTRGNTRDHTKLFSSKRGIENSVTESYIEVVPMTISKLQGLRPKVSSIDEWLSGDITEDVVGAIEQGASKLDDYLIIATSSEGTARNGPGDEIKMELSKILRGEYINPHVSIWWYKLDDVKEVNNPAMWLKANPHIGQTVSWEAYHKDVERAEQVPSARNDILAKRFGLPMEGYTYFFTYEETIPHSCQTYWGLPCSMGMDASQGDDFCAFTFLFPLRGSTFGTKHRCYITERTMMKLSMPMRMKYEEFLKEGSLFVMPGTILDMDLVFDDIDRFISEYQYDVRSFGYDPYGAKGFVNRWEIENGPHGIEKVIQGAKTESIPLGELKKLAEDRELLFDEMIMSFCMGNAIVLEDTNGNRKLWKKRYDAKIDCVASTMDSFVAYKLNKEEFE